MRSNEMEIKLVKAFEDKLKEQISIESQLMISGRVVKIEKIGFLSTTIQPGSIDLNQLIVQNETNLHFAGVIEIFPEGENEEVKSNEFYNFESKGIKVRINSEKKEIEFENEITLSNLNKR